MALRPEWKHRAGGSIVHAFVLTTGTRVVFPFWTKELRRNVRAVDAASGSTVWTSTAPRIESLFRLGSRLYAGGERPRCFAAETGELLVERPVEEVIARPPVAEGPVFFSRDAGVTALLDPETLEERWRVPDPKGQCILHRGFVCRRTMDGTLTVSDRHTGHERCSLAVHTLSGGILHTHCGELWCEFGLSGGGRHAFNLATGQLQWHSQTPGAYGLPAFSDTHAYSASDGVAAYDLRTGQLSWEQPLEEPKGKITSGTPQLTEGLIFVGTQQKAAYVVDSVTGAVVERLEVGFEPKAIRPLDPDRLLVASEDTLYCFKRPSV